MDIENVANVLSLRNKAIELKQENKKLHYKTSESLVKQALHEVKQKIRTQRAYRLLAQINNKIGF